MLRWEGEGGMMIQRLNSACSYTAPDGYTLRQPFAAELLDQGLSSALDADGILEPRGAQEKAEDWGNSALCAHTIFRVFPARMSAPAQKVEVETYRVGCGKPPVESRRRRTKGVV